MATPSRDRDLPVPLGERVGKYLLKEELGRGGMGVVYRATDTQLGRTVALKCPWPEYAADPEHRRRFMREARIASVLMHSGIVPLHEVFEDRELPWLAMPEVEGESLRSLLDREGALDPVRALGYAEQMAHALHYAHAKNILHRDINPRNIMVTGDDEALLTDFGLARYLKPPDLDSALSTMSAVYTQQGRIMGTPHYMSPEQILGRELAPSSDIFSLGTVLYEMIAGVRPFEGEDAGELREAIVVREPTPVSSLSTDVPEGLDGILRRCLAKSPSGRYQDAAELVQDLRRLRRSVEVHSSPDLWQFITENAVRPTRLRLVVTALTTMVVVILALRFLFPGVVSRPDRGFAPRGQPFRVTSSDGWEGEPAISPDGKWIVYVSDAAGNPDLYIVDALGGQPVRLTRDPSAERDPAWFPDRNLIAYSSDRNGTWDIWTIAQTGGEPVVLLQRGDQAAISPDGSRIAFSRQDEGGSARIAVAPLEDPQLVSVLTGDDDGLWWHTSPAWSPDGTEICYAAHSDLWIVPADGGEARPLTRDAENYSYPTWSTDGQRVYASSYREGTLAIWWIAAGGGAPQRLTMGTGPESHPSFSRDGSILAYTTEVGTSVLETLDPATGRTSTLPDLDDCWMPAISPDGTRLAFTTDRWGAGMELRIQEIRDGVPVGQSRPAYNELAGSPSHPVFSPDGKWLAFYRILGEDRDLWVVSSAGGVASRITTDAAQDFHPTWSPDGRYLAYAAGDASAVLKVVPVRDGVAHGAPRTLETGAPSAQAPSWSPAGDRIAFIGTDGSCDDIWVVDVGGGAPPRRLTHCAGAARVHWDERGEGLIASGFWRSPYVSLRRVSMEDGSLTPIPGGERLGIGANHIVFTVWRDGGLIVCSRERLRGDIWVLRAGSAE